MIGGPPIEASPRIAPRTRMATRTGRRETANGSSIVSLLRSHRARLGASQDFRNTVTFSGSDTRVVLKPLSTETPRGLICRIVPNIGHL